MDVTAGIEGAVVTEVPTVRNPAGVRSKVNPPSIQLIEDIRVGVGGGGLGGFIRRGSSKSARDCSVLRLSTSCSSCSLFFESFPHSDKCHSLSFRVY